MGYGYYRTTWADGLIRRTGGYIRLGGPKTYDTPEAAIAEADRLRALAEELREYREDPKVIAKVEARRAAEAPWTRGTPEFEARIAEEERADAERVAARERYVAEFNADSVECSCGSHVQPREVNVGDVRFYDITGRRHSGEGHVIPALVE